MIKTQKIHKVHKYIYIKMFYNKIKKIQKCIKYKK